jgi:hypothetical protein
MQMSVTTSVEAAAAPENPATDPLSGDCARFDLILPRSQAVL